MDEATTVSSAPEADGGSPEPITQTEVQEAGMTQSAELEAPFVGQDQTVPQEENQEEPDWFQKRMNKLTAKNKAGEETIAELQAELEALRSQVHESQKPKESPEPTEAQLRQELAKAAEEGDWSYHAQVTEYIAERKARNEKNTFVTKNKEEQEVAQKQAQEWAMITEEYGQYGLTDKNSQLYKLAEAHYKNNPEVGQYVAVAKAFRELSENGAIRTDKNQNAEQQLQRERRKQQLGSGINAGTKISAELRRGGGEISAELRPELCRYHNEAIKERIQNATKARGGF